MNNKKLTAIAFALLAAVLYAINIPLSKILLKDIEPVYMAGFLYFGAGVGMSAYSLLSSGRSTEARLTKKELPYTVGMIVLDIAAPIFLMFGLRQAASSNASLLNNFEIVVTALIALLVFRERISGRMWIAISLITLSSIILSFNGAESLRFSYGSLFILAACCCWGFENNCTRMLSSKSTTQIVMLKGIFSGLGSLIVAVISKESFPKLFYIVCAMALGFISYGLSIFFYVKAQKELGAAKTSAYYAAAPFVGALLSFIILREGLSKTYLSALLVMLAGTLLVVSDTLIFTHHHTHTHKLVHTVKGVTSVETITHEHSHKHIMMLKEEHNHRH